MLTRTLTRADWKVCNPRVAVHKKAPGVNRGLLFSGSLHLISFDLLPIGRLQPDFSDRAGRLDFGSVCGSGIRHCVSSDRCAVDRAGFEELECLCPGVSVGQKIRVRKQQGPGSNRVGII